MSRSRKGKSVKSNSISAYTEKLPTRRSRDVVQLAEEDSLLFGSLKELIILALSKVTD